ncbi:MAG: DUF86 domain-containing protein [Deltaproteobacteria bacterium]|nr:DUF86 domain-containing protein [Candidatus Tharpella aukensis]
MDKKNTEELLEYILFSIILIEKRFTSICTNDDFLSDASGLEKLDAISMRLQTIGEAIKNILKTDKITLLKYTPSEYWNNIVKLREIISHHYIDIDAEIVFEICDEELAELKENILKAKNNK